MSNGNFKFVQINMKHLLYCDQSSYGLGYNTTLTNTKYDTANSRLTEPHRSEKHILTLTYDEFENIFCGECTAFCHSHRGKRFRCFILQPLIGLRK